MPAITVPIAMANIPMVATSSVEKRVRSRPFPKAPATAPIPNAPSKMP